MATITERKIDETGRKVIIYSDGTVKDAATGYFIAGPPAHRIQTSERGRAMAAIAKENSFRDRARAYARRNGIDPDTATDAEILEGYSRGRESIHGHAYDMFLAAKTARGIEGLYPKLVQVGDGPEEGFKDPYTEEAKVITAVTELVRLLKEAIQPQPQVIDGKISDTGE